MKPFWIQTLLWIAAAVAAVLLAMYVDGMGLMGSDLFPHGADTPR